MGAPARYAIYWTPELDSALARFGAVWFGENGAQETFGLSPDLTRRAVQSPARYTLHATLKAPFRLRGGRLPADLVAALEAFCARRRAVRAGPLQLARFRRYLALVPQPPLAELDWLAAEIATAFDGFRAPLDDAERARRGGGLTHAQAALFETFGYPHVLSAFEFHLTLAGPLDAPDLDAVARALTPALGDITAAPLTVESLTLLADPGCGARFEALSRHRLLPRHAA